MDIYKFLNEKGIDYQKFEHKAVFTCGEADSLVFMSGQPTKNLFLRDQAKRNYFLVVVAHEKKVDLKKLGLMLGISKLSFGSREDLKTILGLESGAVTLLGLINDHNNRVKLIIDNDISGAPLQCHPLVNTATVVLDFKDIERFISLSHHSHRTILVPSRQ